MQIISKVVLGVTLMGSGLVLAQSRTISDQVTVNTQRLYDLERRLSKLEGMADVASETSVRSTINDLKIDNLQNEVREMRSVLVGVAIFVVTHMVGFIIYLLKNNISFGQKRDPRT